MPKPSRSLSGEQQRSTLMMPRAEAQSRIDAQVQKGKKLLELQIRTNGELEQARAERDKWSAYNAELLKRMVDTDDLVNAYYPPYGIISFGDESLAEEVKDFHSGVTEYINRLESIRERLELIPESPQLTAAASPVRASEMKRGKRVFIVHGRDEEAKQSVARCIDQLGLEAVILHEQPNQGRTIIEKFEDYADASYAIILLTPDDVGASKDREGETRPRARQNVILELGFFIGRLGRGKVCALLKGELEIPSDILGILWVNMDTSGAWRLDLAREMKAAGLDVDLNRLA
jgi:predicted nucleotide-binding protein